MGGCLSPMESHSIAMAPLYGIFLPKDTGLVEGPKTGQCKAETARRGRSAGDNLPALTMAGYERQVKGMAVTLSSQEVAALTGKTERTVRRWAESGKFPAERTLNKFNSPEYFFSLNDLTLTCRRSIITSSAPAYRRPASRKRQSRRRPSRWTPIPLMSRRKSPSGSGW